MEDEDSYYHDVVDCVSIVIPTMNAAKTIGRCLESIVTQSYKNIEIFVVDRFSSDNTIEIASRFNASIHSFAGERASAKNFGISKSRGEFLLFIDSDMLLQPGVVQECVTCCSNNKRIAGVIIPERSIGSGFWIKVRDFERSLYAGSKIESARFFIKKFVVQVGGFDEDIVFYEESTLPQKIEDIGMSINTRITSFILHNEEGFTLRKWLHKKRYYSISTTSYSIKYSKYAKMQTSVFYRIKVFTTNGNWRALVRHPILTIGVFILKILEFFASRKG
ncbi:MAG: glycosyltransferase family 2 protein [Nitrososphaeraceae archaeon]|nr:glycosyltransferase family 2 protein [Nitrososphaeraceae archaeon]